MILPQSLADGTVYMHMVRFVAETFQGTGYALEFGWDFRKRIDKLSRRGHWDRDKWRLQTDARQVGDPDKALQAELNYVNALLEGCAHEDARLDWLPADLVDAE